MKNLLVEQSRPEYSGSEGLIPLEYFEALKFKPVIQM